MTWTADHANRRIDGFMRSAPSGAVRVEEFARDYLPRRRRMLAEAGLASADFEPIMDLPYDAAVLTNGVHIYANLIDYNSVLVESGRETEASHRRALQFLHLHCSAIDRLLEAYEVQRVDHHGARVHAVVLTPTGDAGEIGRVEKALSLAAAIRRLVSEGSRLYGRHFQTRVRIGIDSGQAVAVNSGRRDEPEPLFIGDPANIAAKLAAGDTDGVFLSARVEAVRRGLALGSSEGRLELAEESGYLQKSYATAGLGGVRLERRVELAFQDTAYSEAFRRSAVEANFNFHRHEPPLKTIELAKLTPSNSVRQEMASIFADLDGFTSYVRGSIASGQVGQAVFNLHVLRGEMAAVLRDDFGGRKVRFIGDCLHGVLARGDRTSTDERRTVEAAVLCAGGIRSSFELCQSRLSGVRNLGLQIGVEYGSTPITRLGIRGERSIRCSSSKAVCTSEAEQGRCGARDTAVGETAIGKVSAQLRQAFGSKRLLAGLDYPTACALITPLAAPAIARPSPQPLRAHSRG